MRPREVRDVMLVEEGGRADPSAASLLLLFVDRDAEAEVRHAQRGGAGRGKRHAREPERPPRAARRGGDRARGAGGAIRGQREGQFDK